MIFGDRLLRKQILSVIVIMVPLFSTLSTAHIRVFCSSNEKKKLNYVLSSIRYFERAIFYPSKIFSSHFTSNKYLTKEKWISTAIKKFCCFFIFQINRISCKLKRANNINITHKILHAFAWNMKTQIRKIYSLGRKSYWGYQSSFILISVFFNKS